MLPINRTRQRYLSVEFTKLSCLACIVFEVSLCYACTSDSTVGCGDSWLPKFIQVPGVLQNRSIYAGCWWGTTPCHAGLGDSGTAPQDEPSQSLALVGFLWLLGCRIVEAAADHVPVVVACLLRLLHHTIRRGRYHIFCDIRVLSTRHTKYYITTSSVVNY